MKHYIKYISFSLLVLLFASCGDDFYDVNTPYGNAVEEELSMGDLLGPAIYHTVQAQYSAASGYGYYTQYFTGQGGNGITTTSTSGVWSNAYLYSLPNLQSVINKATEENAVHYRGIAKALLAMNMGLVADCYDNAPYSQAGFRTENLTPTFDTQEDIYNSIFGLLDEAITDLSATDNSGFSPGRTDLIYDGDVSKWLKTAYMLKARYTMHLSEVNGSTSVANEVLGYLNNAYSGNGDDFQLFYDERNINPWHSREVLAANTGNFHHKIGDQIVSLMNGSFYPLTNISYDPRLPVYADNMSTSGAPFRGYVTGGEGLSSDGESANTDFADAGYYSSLASPIVVLSYAEAEFLRAEAEFLKSGGTMTSTGSSSAAYDAYMAGIAANMSKLGVDGSAYMGEESIAVGASNLMLNHIMKEKYIANFLNPETFTDYRRYDFSDDVFMGLQLPLDNADTDWPGQWFTRSQYPTSEVNRNPANVAANQQSPVTPVWWDR